MFMLQDVRFNYTWLTLFLGCLPTLRHQPLFANYHQELRVHLQQSTAHDSSNLYHCCSFGRFRRLYLRQDS